MMNIKLLNENRIIALLVLLIALITLFKTVSPSVSFWDPGERIAAAYLVQVPHPPGAPLFVLVGRVFSMIPFAEDIAFRVNTISVLAGAFTVLLLYLMITRLITYYRGVPQSLSDKFITYGSGVIGSLSLLWSQTFWFNATEAETYATSLFLMTLVVWLAFLWYEKADQPGSERYLLVGAFIIGLSLGVHLLSVLAIFPVALIIYFRKFQPDWNSFFKYGLIVLGVFFVIYPGIVKLFPSMLAGNLIIGDFLRVEGSGLLPFVPPLIVIGALYGLYKSVKEKKKYYNLALLTFLLITFGFTTYATVIIRSNANPPMNQNQPDNLKTLVSYLNREQYGQVPLFDRRWNPEQRHQVNYRKYSSDFDYMIRYQFGHMYVRYLAHNFIGKEGDWQDAGVDWRKLYGLPFLLGLIGLWYHAKRDWKWGVVFLSFFIITGFALAFYFNIAEPPPRERDYFFAGSFFVFAAWIGLGTAALLDSLSKIIKNQKTLPAILGVSLVGLFFASPYNLLSENYKERDRSGHYVAWDYAYNLLQSVEKDGILFTNGDNDTFPLWYLQDVEGIRRDVRVVNLSLLNTHWYIRQLKFQRPHGAEPVPISFSEREIDLIRVRQWEPRELEIPVPEHIYDMFEIDVPEIREKGKIQWTMYNTADVNGIPIIRVQDIMVRDIVQTAAWERPVYFAITIPDDGSKIGLDEYLRLDGLVHRVMPFRLPDNLRIGEEQLHANLFDEPEGFYREPRFGYKFRGLNDPSVHLEDQSRRLMINYRNAFINLAYYYDSVENDNQRIITVLDRMEEVIPRTRVDMNPGMQYEIARMYRRAGDEQKFVLLTEELIATLEKEIQDMPMRPLTMGNPYIILYNIYHDMNDLRREREILNKMLVAYREIPDVVRFAQRRIDEIDRYLITEEEPEDDHTAPELPDVIDDF